MICSAVLMTNFLLMMVFHLVVIEVLHTHHFQMWLRMHFSIHCAVLELTLRLIVVERLIGQSQLGLTTSQLECHTELHLPSRVKITKHFSTAQWMRTKSSSSNGKMRCHAVRAFYLLAQFSTMIITCDRGENVQKLPLVAIRKEKCTLAIGQWCCGRNFEVWRTIDHSSRPPLVRPSLFYGLILLFLLPLLLVF